VTRVLAGAVLGWIVGLGLTAVLLRTTWAVLPALTGGSTLAIEHSTIYLTLVLGSGFGSWTGALVGLSHRKDEGRRMKEESAEEVTK
jgi:hypothetical protein